MQNYLTQKVGGAVGGGGVGEFTERIKDKARHSSLLCFSHVTNSQHCKFRPSDKGGGGPGPSPGSTTETSGKINLGEKCFQSNLPHRCS